MSTGRIVLLVLTLIMVTCSTERTPLSESELMAYVMNPGNGTIVSQERDGITFDMIYRPKDMVIASQVDDDPDRWKEEERRLDSLDYFVLRISRDGEEIQNSFAGNEAKFNSAISWLGGRIANDLYLVTDRKEHIPPDQTVFVPSFGMAKATSVLIVFRSALSQRKGKHSIVLRDSEFGTGMYEFSFDSENIRSIPRLQR